ncbi:hypothetical protein DFH07DRAFT_843404 [Mycena maculata]|uniref:Zn(2)-C6 fungal-type domain-containing protein n=1 Tax=Mycena maculata TaxID=230809 RepID=A0AAD7I5Q4_9AGAR|nr:hypothetical protein DFH07DRAFT_843404 [Mycena maculata]
MQTPALDRIVFPQGRPVVVLSAGPRRTTISGTYNDLAGPNESPFAPNPFAFLQEVNETSKRGLEKELGKDYVAIQDALASIIREQELSKHYAAMPDVVAAIIQSLEARKNFLQFQFSPNSFQPNSQSTSYTRTGQGTINSIDGALYGYTQNSGFLGTDQREYHNNPTTYNFQAAASPTPLTATGFSAITTGTTTPARSPYYPPRSGSSQPGQTKVKRQRVPEPINEPKDEDMEEEEGGARAKPPGACVRCKNLKVKCEFKTKTDPCKRCFNGGHDCVTPGRKKRRTPPKRERLLNQIREQAAEIQKLMAQLEETNARAHPPNSSATDAFPLSPSSGSDLQSPVLSPSTNASYFGSDPSSSRDDSEAEKAVEDWIAKARDSLAEFDGFIGIGGAGMPKSYLIKEDLEDSNSEEEQEGASSDEPAPEYEIEVLDSEGEEVTHRGRRNKIRQLSSSSSTNGARSPKKKDSGGMDKLATLPSEASPFGLMADVSLKMGRAESPEDM